MSPNQTDSTDKFDDPRKVNPNNKNRIKTKGHGRNTESFDPNSTLIRPDMRIIIGMLLYV